MNLRRFTLLGMTLLLATAAYGKKKISDFKEVGDDEAATQAGDASVAGGSSNESAKEEAKSKIKDGEEILTGTVSVLRKITLTEAFFKDLKESYYIPAGSQNYPIFKAFTDSSKKGTKVTFKVNKKSRQVLSLEDGATASPGAGEAGATSKSGSK